MVEDTVGGTCLFVNGCAGDVNPEVGVGRSYGEMLRVGARAGGAAIELLHREAAAAGEGVGAVRADLLVDNHEHPYLDIALDRRLSEDRGLITEVQAMRLGPLSLISQPGECLVETGRAILGRTRLRDAVIAGYTNDYVGYLPLPHIYEEGGYEPASTMLPASSVLQVVDKAVEVADALADQSG